MTIGDYELIVNYKNLFIDTPFNLISKYIKGSSHSYDDEDYINQVYLYGGSNASGGRIRRAQAPGNIMRFFINIYINNINRGVCVFTNKFKNIGHLNIALYVKNDGLVVNYSPDHLFGRFSTSTIADNNIALCYEAFYTYDREPSNILTVLKDINNNIIFADLITTDPKNQSPKAPNFIYSSDDISLTNSIYSELLKNLRDCQNISFYKNFLNYSNNSINLNNELNQLVKSSLTKNNANIIKNLTTGEVIRQPLLNAINKINNYPTIRDNDLKVLLYLLNDNSGTIAIPTLNIPDYSEFLNDIKKDTSILKDNTETIKTNTETLKTNTETIKDNTKTIKDNTETIINKLESLSTDKLDAIIKLINNIFTNNEEGGMTVDSSSYSALNRLYNLITDLQTEINDIKSSITNTPATNNLTIDDIINELKKKQTDIENYFNSKFNNIQSCQCSNNINYSIDTTDIINKLKPLISELKTLILLLSTNNKQSFPPPKYPLRQQKINPQPMTYNPNIF